MTDRLLNFTQTLQVSTPVFVSGDDGIESDAPTVFIVKIRDRWRVLVEREVTNLDQWQAMQLAQVLIAHDMESAERDEKIEAAAKKIVRREMSPMSVIGRVMQVDLDELRDAVKQIVIVKENEHSSRKEKS